MSLFDLAKKNMRGNFRSYFVYFISMLISVVIYYTFVSLQYSTEIVHRVESSESMRSVFMMASVILLLFVTVFILYSNQFFTRKRKKEIGLYSLLGLPKRTIGRMLFYENLIIGALVLGGGIAAGAFLSKLFSMILIRLLGMEVELGMSFSFPALLNTVVVFAVLMVITSVRAYRLIYQFKLVELFRAEHTGEQEPKASALSGVAAVLCLLIGYGFAFRDFSDNQDILINLGMMTGGIVLGTVLLFSSLVIVLLKAAKRNKRRYFRGMNLIITSNLVYRMKGNARTLSVISLLSAAALCAFSFGFGMYYNFEQTVRSSTPFSYMYIAQDDAFHEQANRIIREDAAHPVIAQVAIPVIPMKGEASSTDILSESDREAVDRPIKVISVSDYNRAAEKLGLATLQQAGEENAIAVRPMYTDYEWKDYEGETITLQTEQGPVTLAFSGMTAERVINWSYPDIMIVVSDTAYSSIAAQQKPIHYEGYIVEDQAATKETADALAAIQTPESQLSTFYSEYRLGIEEAAFSLFVMGFLGFVFVTATGSIIYFKQLSEAESDQARYGILRKIGVNRREINAAISKQIALIFLLPLLIGLAHYLAILYFLRNLFSGMSGIDLTLPIAICVAVFLLIYAVYYVVTVNSISKLVNSAASPAVRAAGAAVLAGMLALVGGFLWWSEPPVPQNEAAYGERIRLELPEPTGGLTVGMTEMHLVQEDRADPWVRDQPRELMISIWYPAQEADGRKALYMPPGAAEHYDRHVIPTIGVDSGRIDLSGIGTHAWANAPAAANAEGWPVILYSPGGSVPRSFGTIVAEDLASRGYAVVAVDHTYEASAVEFPDGRVLTDRLPALSAEVVLTMLEIRVDDIRFVLDRLAEVEDMPLDLSKVGIYGHSAGGATAAQAMYEDSRIDAGIDMDGTIGYMPDHPLPVAQHGLDRPFLLMNAGYNKENEVDSHLTAEDRAMFWERSTGWKLDLSVPKGAHYTFTDQQFLLPALRSKLSLSPQVLQQSVGTVDPDRIIAAQRDYIAAFFDLQLKGIPQPLLAAPSPLYPEVEFIE